MDVRQPVISPMGCPAPYVGTVENLADDDLWLVRYIHTETVYLKYVLDTGTRP